MKTIFTSGTRVSSLFLNTLNGKQLRFIHPLNTPINSMNDGEYYQLGLSDIDVSSLDTRYVTTGTVQTVTGSKTFTNGLASTVVPVNPADVIRLQELNDLETSINNDFVTLGTTQTITGSKTFTNGLSSTLVPVNPTDVIRLQEFNDLETSINTDFVTLGTTQTITGSKTFTNGLSSTLVPVNPADVIRLQELNDLETSINTDFVTLGTTQTITGSKTFTNGLSSTVVPVNPADVIRLQELNDLEISINNDFVTLGTTQTITGSKTFTNVLECREPATGKEAINLRDAATRFQTTARVKITILPSVISQVVNSQYLDIFDPAVCTISYNRAAYMSGLVLAPHGTQGIFSYETRYGEPPDDPSIFARFSSTLVGGSGYVYLSYSQGLFPDITTVSNGTSNPTEWQEIDEDNLIRRAVRGDIRTVLAGSVGDLLTSSTPMRAFSFVQMLESPANVFNPRSGQFNLSGAKEIILSF